MGFDANGISILYNRLAKTYEFANRLLFFRFPLAFKAPFANSFPKLAFPLAKQPLFANNFPKFAFPLAERGLNANGKANCYAILPSVFGVLKRIAKRTATTRA